MEIFAGSEVSKYQYHDITYRDLENISTGLVSSHEDRGRCPESFQTYFKPELDKSDELRNFSMLIYVLTLKLSTMTVEAELYNFQVFIHSLIS